MAATCKGPEATSAGHHPHQQEQPQRTLDIHPGNLVKLFLFAEQEVGRVVAH